MGGSGDAQYPVRIVGIISAASGLTLFLLLPAVVLSTVGIVMGISALGRERFGSSATRGVWISISLCCVSPVLLIALGTGVGLGLLDWR
jgi:hypothetical protein